MNNTSTLLIICALVIQGCAMERTVSKNTATDNRQCVTNFSSEGSFWTGKQFKTFESFPKSSKENAFDNLVSTIASNGYQILNSSKESGIISANQTVSYGQGKTVPLNAVIKNVTPTGVRVDLSFSLSGGLAASADSIQVEFCKILAAVNQTQ